MKLSKLYSNEPLIFKEIEFNEGLNVILGEIRLAENQQRDTHNLGKSTVGRLIDFCLLAKRNKNFFLFKHIDIFENFTFFLELQLLDGSFLTIRRSVEKPSKISFKKHTERFKDYSELEDEHWDHLDLAFDRAKQMLDGLLNFQDLSPWGYRMILGYLLRTQNDYNDIFQLSKFKSKHADWKPFIASVMGFDGDTIEKHYEEEATLETKRKEKGVLLNEIGGTSEDVTKINGLLLIKGKELAEKQSLIDAFDFREEDRVKTSVLVDEIEADIADLNSERYIKSASIRKVIDSLKEGEIVFNPEKAKELFDDAGIFFEGQIKKSFEQLIDFNKAITEERMEYLREEKKSLDGKLNSLNEMLDKLNSERKEALSFLKDTDVFHKFKKTNRELASLTADMELLKRQKETSEKIGIIDEKIDKIERKVGKLKNRISQDVNFQDGNNDSHFSKIRIYYNSIVEKVISRKALLTTPINKLGHIDFNVSILDESGKVTSASDGSTYKKLLSIAFDMAVIRSYIDSKFPRFMFHDGVFESLDDRKKVLLISMIRQYAVFGVQQIITLIDSELPVLEEGHRLLFGEDEVVLRLHDEDNSGQLFMMEPW